MKEGRDGTTWWHAAFPQVRGIRRKSHAASSPANVQIGAPGSMSDPAWRRGYTLLEKYGLSFELQTPWWRLPEAAALNALALRLLGGEQPPLRARA